MEKKIDKSKKTNGNQVHNHSKKINFSLNKAEHFG